MYSTIAALALESASLAIAAPAPKERDPGTREDWRKQHAFKTPHEDKELKLLPSDKYFKGVPMWSPFDKDFTTLQKDMKALTALCKNGNWRNCIIRDSRGEIIGTIDDFKSYAVLNLDKPNADIRIDDKGIFFGAGVTIEDIGTGQVCKDGYFTHPAAGDFDIRINAHSAGCKLDVTHAHATRKMKVAVLSSGPADVTFGEKAQNVHVTLRQDKPFELKEVHHAIRIDSTHGKSINVEDTGSVEELKHTRTFTFNWDGANNAHLPRLTVETTAFRDRDDRATHSVDFHLRDQVRESRTRTEKVSYVIGNKPAMSQRVLGEAVEAAAEKIRKQADELREFYRKRDAEREKEGKAPLTPKVEPLKGGDIKR